MHLYLVIDEYNDVAEPEIAAQFCDKVMDVLRNPYQQRDSDDKLASLIESFWHRALALTMPHAACIDHFVEGFQLYMESMVQEAEDRKSKRVRPVDDYLQLRRMTAATQAIVALLGFGLELPRQVLSHPVMQTMLLVAMDLFCIVNDMHSYVKELARGIAFHNIISSIMQDHGLDVPRAMDWLNDLGKDRVRTFRHGIENLPSWGLDIDGKVHKYIDNIGYLIRGYDAWSFESERYWGHHGSEVKRTRLVTFPPQVEDTQEGLITRKELEAAVSN